MKTFDWSFVSSPTALAQKLWNYCNILRDDGLSYGDYVEQLTFLLFLKIADEQSKPPFKRKSVIPGKYSWSEQSKQDELGGNQWALSPHATGSL